MNRPCAPPATPSGDRGARRRVAGMRLIATACGSTPASVGPSPASPSSTTSPTPRRPPPPPTRRRRRAVPAARPSSPGPPATHKPDDDQDRLGRDPRRRPRRLPALPGRQGRRLAGRAGQRRVRDHGRPSTTVARWYRDALEAAAYATLDLSDPLEDGSRVLDSQGDLPECQVQTTFRPEGGFDDDHRAVRRRLRGDRRLRAQESGTDEAEAARPDRGGVLVVVLVGMVALLVLAGCGCCRDPGRLTRPQHGR